MPKNNEAGAWAAPNLEGLCLNGKRDNPKHRRSRYNSQHQSLAAVVAAADTSGRRAVEICRCPYCAELLIVPEHPITVALPAGGEGAP
jgi:uncharacterized protein with PIN domain